MDMHQPSCIISSKAGLNTEVRETKMQKSTKSLPYNWVLIKQGNHPSRLAFRVGVRVKLQLGIGLELGLVI